MKRLLVTLLIALSLLAPALVFAGDSFAVDIFPHCGTGSANGKPDVCNNEQSQAGNNGANNPVIAIIKVAINIISFIVGVAAVVGIIVSALRMIISNGDSQAFATARTGVLYSLIGIVIVIFAQIIVIFILDRLLKNG